MKLQLTEVILTDSTLLLILCHIVKIFRVNITIVFLWTIIRTGEESRITLGAKKEACSAQIFKLCEEVCLKLIRKSVSFYLY